MNTKAFLTTCAAFTLAATFGAAIQLTARLNSDDHMTSLDKKLETITKDTRDKVHSTLLIGTTAIFREASGSVTYTNHQGELCNTTITRELDMWGKNQVSDDQVTTKCGLTKDPNFTRLELR